MSLKSLHRLRELILTEVKGKSLADINAMLRKAVEKSNARSAPSKRQWGLPVPDEKPETKPPPKPPVKTPAKTPPKKPGTGKPCGDSYISSDDTCHIGEKKPSSTKKPPASKTGAKKTPPQERSAAFTADAKIVARELEKMFSDPIVNSAAVTSAQKKAFEKSGRALRDKIRGIAEKHGKELDASHEAARKELQRTLGAKPTVAQFAEMRKGMMSKSAEKYGVVGDPRCHDDAKEGIKEAASLSGSLVKRSAKLLVTHGTKPGQKPPAVDPVTHRKMGDQMCESSYLPSHRTIQTGMIAVLAGETKFTVFHEWGHHVESEDPDTMLAAVRFLQRRTKGQKPVSLDKVMPGACIGMKGPMPKVTIGDPPFADPYTGREYDYPSTEAFSTGMSAFASPELMKDLWDKDPDHFTLVYGQLMRGRK